MKESAVTTDKSRWRGWFSFGGCVLLFAGGVAFMMWLWIWALNGGSTVAESLEKALDQRIVTASMSDDPKAAAEELRGWLRTFDERRKQLAPFQPSRELVQVALNELTTVGDSSSESSLAAVRQHLRFVPRIGAVVDAHEESKRALYTTIGLNSAASQRTYYRTR